MDKLHCTKLYYTQTQVCVCVLTGEKVTNNCSVIVYLFLKFIYLFIYRTDKFRLFLSRHQGACYMVQRKKKCVYFEYTVIYISVLQFQFTKC